MRLTERELRVALKALDESASYGERFDEDAAAFQAARRKLRDELARYDSMKKAREK